MLACKRIPKHFMEPFAKKYSFDLRNITAVVQDEPVEESVIDKS